MAIVRAAAIIVEGGRVALIERRTEGRGVYYLFPGGHLEAGETPAAAAAREVHEELGLDVEIERLIAEITYKGNVQACVLARVFGGTFGPGDGAEIVDQVEADRGSYTPVWLDVAQLLAKPVFPARVAELVVTASSRGWAPLPYRGAEAELPRTPPGGDATRAAEHN